MTTSISSEALWNYKENIWKMKIEEKKEQKDYKNHEST